MTDNLGDWLAANEIYQGVPAIVQHLRSQGHFYIVTTKQVEYREPLLALLTWSEDLWTATVSLAHCPSAPAHNVLWLLWDQEALSMGIVQARFTEALMHNMAKVPIPSEDIFSTTVSGQPKSEILVELQRQHPGLTYHFVEDKLGTLEKVRSSKVSLEIIHRPAVSFDNFT